MYLTCELLQFLESKIMLKLQRKTTFKFAFVGKNFIKIEQELTLKSCFEQMWFYMIYIVINCSDRILSGRLCIQRLKTSQRLILPGVGSLRYNDTIQVKKYINV